MYTKQKRKPLKASANNFLFILCLTLLWHSFCNIRMEVCAAEKAAIELNVSNKKMIVGERFILKATITNKIAKNHNIQWKSSKNSVASVSQKGSVKAKKKGTAKITATIKGTSHKATCTIHVTDIFNQKNLLQIWMVMENQKVSK